MGAAGVAVLTAPAFALTAQTAEAAVQRLVGEVNAVIDGPGSDSAKIKKFERIFRKYADTAFIAQYALGADRRRASNAQLRRFSDAFGVYVSRKYGRRFREFIGGRLEVLGTRKVKSVFEVQTRAYLRGSSPFDVRFQLSDRSGKTLFVNMFIEGVNMLLSERAEIGALLDRRGGDIDKLTADLRNI